ncbi:hypothetical protein HYN43_016835 [Mucilaginibacter celer]|uniref:Uncharacterized protein n=1 Tax=Mucilaginibacter celer TaxID=2305508 RepID=A0A494W081_9SPHI|nr:hypothetical protein HYN43_016835 [Mucilaginibacter celer]
MPLVLTNGLIRNKQRALAKIHLPGVFWLKPFSIGNFHRWLKPTAMNKIYLSADQIYEVFKTS